MNSQVIGIDFDGTCVTHKFPELGHEIGAPSVLKELVKNGHKLVLFTMRSNKKSPADFEEKFPDLHPDVNGEFLQMAIDWFKSHDIPLYGIQTNPTQHEWTESPKAYCNLYIDDAALGCPITYNLHLSDRPFVDWGKVRTWLIFNGFIDDNRIHTVSY